MRSSRLACKRTHFVLFPKRFCTSSEYHVPVMLKECCDYLIADSVPGIYIDCTLGGGGHTAELLRRGGSVVAIDQDEDALNEVRKSKYFYPYIRLGKLELLRGNFRTISSLVSSSKLLSNRPADGVLMDLGVSSHQIDHNNRGFSYMQNGPLDMRMRATEGPTAGDVVNTISYEALADLLYQFGGERKSFTIAREIIAARPLHTTEELRRIIDAVTPASGRISAAARCFQALRIAVNDELGALDSALLAITTDPAILRPGGRFVALSYHSLEDRRVKQMITNKLLSGNALTSPAPVWKSMHKKPQHPHYVERRDNPRSRSAILRAAEKLVYDVS